MRQTALVLIVSALFSSASSTLALANTAEQFLGAYGVDATQCDPASGYQDLSSLEIDFDQEGLALYLTAYRAGSFRMEEIRLGSGSEPYFDTLLQQPAVNSWTTSIHSDHLEAVTTLSAPQSKVTQTIKLVNEGPALQITQSVYADSRILSDTKCRFIRR